MEAGKVRLENFSYDRVDCEAEVNPKRTQAPKHCWCLLGVEVLQDGSPMLTARSTDLLGVDQYQSGQEQCSH